MAVYHGHRRTAIDGTALFSPQGREQAVVGPGRLGHDRRVEDIAKLVAGQDGVVSRRQARAAGMADHDVRRMLRRREWVQVHPGVYLDHTGAPTWVQRAWAGVLSVWPAALSHASAIRAADGPGRRQHDDSLPVQVAVDRRRSPVAPAGVILHHLADVEAKVQWNLGPPRVRIEQAVVDVAAEAPDDLSCIQTLAQTVQSRRTTAERLRAALDGRSRIARRAFLDRVLSDIGRGTCSVLEHGYLDRVERPDGLPLASRQLAAKARGVIYRDVSYEDYALVVELDGRLFHDDTVARDADLDRDLDAAVEGRTSVQRGWAGQVRPCRSAGQGLRDPASTKNAVDRDRRP